MRSLAIAFLIASSGPQPLPSQVTPTLQDLQRQLTILRRQNDSLRRLVDSLQGRSPTSVSRTAPPLDAQDFAPKVSSIDRGGRSSQIVSQYDRFRDVTIVSLKEIPLPDGIALTPFYTMPGTSPSRPIAMNLFFSSTSTEWRFLDCHNVEFLVDGRRLPIESPKHDGKVGKGSVAETVSFSMPVATFTALASGTIVEGRLCRTVFQFNPEQMFQMRALAARIP